ncbi:MAG: ATP-dependent Clp protease adaptor ClpS [Candidatus Sericytochromatia bacterium]|nr:ATP-dependent Clp protease adaptor ClpS [Candidatus Sericytochromatia bacterium]
MKDFEINPDSDIALEDEEEIALKRPSMYRVLLHNDAYTPREFVVIILQSVFHKSEEEGKKIMTEAHTKGMATVGIYTHEIASTSIYLVEKMADEYGCPLRCTMEEVEI